MEAVVRSRFRRERVDEDDDLREAAVGVLRRIIRPAGLDGHEIETARGNLRSQVTRSTTDEFKGKCRL